MSPRWRPRRRRCNCASTSRPLVADLRQPEECDRVVAETARPLRQGRHPRQQRRADLHLYRPGAVPPATSLQRFWQVGDEIIDNVITTNYLAADRLSRRVAPAMIERGWGRIVNVTTKLDTMNRIGTHPYGASKAALEMATEVWAKDVEGTGLTINIVNPGAGANTPGMADEMRECSREGRRRAPRRTRRDGAAAALRRVARGRRGQRLALRRQCLGCRRCRRRRRRRRAGRPAGFVLHPQE